MAKASAKLSKTRLFDPNKVSEEFALKISGNCMSPIVEDGEDVVVDRRKKINKGNLVVIYFKPEYVQLGDVQAKLKRIIHTFPTAVKFPFHYKKEQFASTGLGPIIIVEQLNPPRTFSIDLRKVLGVYRAERCPADVKPIVRAVPRKAFLKRPTKRNAKLRRAT